MNAQQQAALARKGATEKELLVMLAIGGLDGAPASPNELLARTNGKWERKRDALERLVERGVVGWTPERNWFVVLSDGALAPALKQNELLKSAAAFMAQHDVVDYRISGEVRDVPPSLDGGGRTRASVRGADGTAPEAGLSSAAARSPSSPRGGSDSPRGGSDSPRGGELHQKPPESVPPTGGIAHVRHVHVSEIGHDHVLHVGPKPGPFVWMPEAKLDVGDIEPKCARDIFQAVQQAGRGRIAAKFLDDWKKRVFEAPHVVWGLARQLIDQEKHSDAPEKFLNFHYLRIVCDRRALPRERVTR